MSATEPVVALVNGCVKVLAPSVLQLVQVYLSAG